jgi:hypothetical protein
MGRGRTRLERLEALLPDPFDQADGLVPTTDNGVYVLETGGSDVPSAETIAEMRKIAALRAY